MSSSEAGDFFAADLKECVTELASSSGGRLLSPPVFPPEEIPFSF